MITHMNKSPINKEFIISFDKPESPPDSDSDDIDIATLDSNQLIFQTKFRGLERKARKLEATVMSVFEARSNPIYHFKVNPLKRSFSFREEPCHHPQKQIASLSKIENVAFVRFLANFYLRHLNGVGLIFCENVLRQHLESEPFDSLLVLASCSLAYPIVMNLLSRPNFSPKENPFYQRLKIKLSSCFETPDLIALTALTACCVIEFGLGDPVPLSLSIVKGVRLLSLVGIHKDETLEDLFSRNHVSLVRSFLWNFWANCKLLEAPVKNFKKDVYFDFTSEHFECMRQLPSFENLDDSFASGLIHIFNQQLFRQITYFQKLLVQPNPNFDKLFSSSFQLLTKVQMAEPSIYEWITALSTSDKKIQDDKMFLAKSSNVATFLSLHILLLNLLTQIPKSSEDGQRLASLPNVLDICEKTLTVLSVIEKKGQLIFSRTDAHFVNSICINLSIPYYYMLSACLQDYSPRGYVVFYTCLEKLRGLASCWAVVTGWILSIVDKRKENLPFISPPLAFSNK